MPEMLFTTKTEAMLSQKEKYDFSQPSSSGKAGFESFRSDKDGLYYFHFNDAEGLALLFSQGYSSMKSCKNGLQSLENNIGLRERLDYHTEGKAHFFTVKAGNKQEIARSRLFESEGEMEKAIGFILEEVRGAAPAVARAVPAATAVAEEEAPAGPSKFSFRLDFYKPGAEEPLRGRIEYALNREDKLAFEGVDLDKIANFLASHLPAEGKAALETARPRDWKAEEAEVRILREGSPAESPIFSSDAAFEVQMKVDARKEKAEAIPYELQVYAHSLEEGSWVLVGEKEGRLPQTGRASAPVMAMALHPGAYRLVATLKLHEKERDTRIRGSRLIQVC